MHKHTAACQNKLECLRSRGFHKVVAAIESSWTTAGGEGAPPNLFVRSFLTTNAVVTFLFGKEYDDSWCGVRRRRVVPK